MYTLLGHKYLNTRIIPIEIVLNSLFHRRVCTNCILAILHQSLYSDSAHLNSHLAAFN